MKHVLVLVLSGLLLIGCSSIDTPQDPVPDHDSFTIKSALLGEVRRINVWVPPGYSSGKDSLPVMYMPDGGVKEDFPHIANTIAALVKSGRIPPMILAGIENIQRRKDLTGPTDVAEDKKVAPVVGGAENFRAFIREELFSAIDQRYRTAAVRGIIGESLAGLFIVETLLTASEMFDYYIAMDPSLWWNNHYLVNNVKIYLAKQPPIAKRFWFAASNTEDIAPYVKAIASQLGTPENKYIRFKFSDKPRETHATIYRATKEDALSWVFAPADK